MAQRRAEYICILIAAILFYAFCTDFISLFILLNVLFLPVMSVVLTCFSGLSLEASIENPDTTQAEVGDELRVYVRVRNPARLGGARVRMNLLINYELEGKVHTEKMRFVTERSEQMTACLVSAQHCGRITCRIEKLRLYDYLWLFAIPGKASHDRCSFTVMPKLPDIDPLAVPTLREAASMRRTGRGETTAKSTRSAATAREIRFLPFTINFRPRERNSLCARAVILWAAVLCCFRYCLTGQGRLRNVRKC